MINNTTKYILLLFLMFCVVCAAQSRKELEGVVLDADTKKEIPFVTIYIPQFKKGAFASSNGKFKIQLPSIKKLTLEFSCLGYKTLKLPLDEISDTSIKIFLKPQSLHLDEIIVNAQYSKSIGTKASISQETLTYINPTSIKDVLTLLPGGNISSNNIYKRSLIGMRQAGKDNNTSLGVGISIDGVPMHNDGLRIQFAGYTGFSSIDNNVAINTGVDLRTLSTDHVDKVIVNNGIASAKEGNLSSGLIKVFSKKGKSPLKIRTKLDPLNKLMYLGKGFFLSKKLGTLHLGLDVTISSDDVRNEALAYNRITGQANYNNQFSIFSNQVDFNLKSSFISSFNNSKKDEKTVALKENYETYYKRYMLSSKLSFNFEEKFLDNIEFLCSLDYSEDVLKHKKNVRLATIRPMQYAQEEGEHEGIYLPQSYFTSYEIQNKPLNLFTSLNASKSGFFSDKFNYNLSGGTTFSYTKNIGKGIIANKNKPPFPSNSFIRARPNYKVPSLVNNAWYLESRLNYTTSRSTVNSSLGIRATKMMNLPDNYILRNIFLLEPRLQFSYQLKSKLKGNEFKNSIRLGYGVENKLPTLDYLYPDKIYRDFIVLNAYFTDPKKRLLLTNTKIFDPTNKNIRENKNEKIEIGWQSSYNKWELAITLFKEKMSNGIQYFPSYYPVKFRYYDKLKYPVNGQPKKEDYHSYIKQEFAVNKKPTNSSKVEKKGIEYRLSIPKISSVNSKIEINGAYFHSLYTNGIPVMNYPSVVQNNEVYPYVGIYNGFDKVYQERLNTNVWIHTHIPKLKLIFTNFVQLDWFSSYRKGNDVSIYPTKYMNLDGVVTSVSPEEIDNNKTLSSLKRRLPDVLFNTVKKSLGVTVNSKVTKEFGKSVRLAFFMNNLLQYNPEYNSKIKTKQRDIRSPFFGFELIVKL